MGDREKLLAAYDADLRTEAEVAGAVAVHRIGPLWLATFAGGRGFISYRDLDGSTPEGIERLVSAAVAHFLGEPDVREVEWKTRGHDHAPGLHEALVRHGFEPGEPESIMIGEAQALAVDVPLPAGVTLRRVTEPDDIRAAVRMQNEVFDEPDPDAYADELLDRRAHGEDFEMWVAEADGEIVTAGRLVPVPGTLFAGIWGGATREEWRGRGIYRALTAERARSALARGLVYIHSDSTEYSRPILERSGFVKVSTTTPYEWHRPAS